MSPRRYRLGKRSVSVAETRQRIVEATLRLHGEKGIFGTSWQDIARSADVSLGTVYKHFPSLDDLVPACGELLMRRIRPPSPDDADQIIGGARDEHARLTRVIAALFEFYERGGAHLESDARERQLPAMQEWEKSLREMVTHFLRTALRDRSLRSEELKMASALLDLQTYRAMRTREIAPARAIEQTASLVMCFLGTRKDV